jgi:hypothetical protein
MCSIRSTFEGVGSLPPLVRREQLHQPRFTTQADGHRRSHTAGFNCPRCCTSVLYRVRVWFNLVRPWLRLLKPRPTPYELRAAGDLGHNTITPTAALSLIC